MARQTLRRTAEILGLVVGHGFGYLLNRGDRQRGLRRLKSAGPAPDAQLGRWERVRLLLEALGPTFIKMGQMFSNRPDLLPEGLLVELRKLQDGVPGFDFALVRQQLEAQYGKPLEDVFLRFEAEPVACASIAQVHRAQLPDGRAVAVKILRPGIEEVVATDLEILEPIGQWLEKLILRSDVIDTRAILREFGRTMRRELDFQNEGRFLDKFGANFRDDADILVPRWYPALSSQRTLVMDFVVGNHPLDWSAYRRLGLDRSQLARTGARLLLKQVFVHGFFHADPHPGNLLILDDGRICFLDFGMMGILFERHRLAMAQILFAVSQNDARALTRALLELAQNADDENPALEDEVALLLETFAHVPLAQLDLGAFLGQAVTLVLTHRLELPPTLYLLIKALLTIEGFARQLDPGFDLVAEIEPFVRDVLGRRLDPLKAGGRGAESLVGYLNLAADLPDELRASLKQLRRGRLRLEIDPSTLDPILHKADKISNRLSFSLVVTGGLLASSLALSSKIPPLWNDIPLIAIAGYFGSFVLGLALVVSIWRSGRF